MKELIENIDYYFDEEGFFVFTEKYHLKRGHCCDRGCKHCPYKFENYNGEIDKQKLSAKKKS
jgi:hypothetical protein